MVKSNFYKLDDNESKEGKEDKLAVVPQAKISQSKADQQRGKIKISI